MKQARYMPGVRGKICLILLLVAGLLPVVHADIYRYVDKYGRVTLTDRPPNSNYKLLVKTWKGWEEKKSRIALRDFDKNQKKFMATINRIAKVNRLPKALLHAVIATESAYDPDATSKTGAVGLMQLMPATARHYGVRDRRDPAENIIGGTLYLKDLLQMFNNNLPLALAAYNSGANTVKAFGNKIPPFEETRDYVRKVIEYYKTYQKSI